MVAVHAALSTAAHRQAPDAGLAGLRAEFGGGPAPADEDRPHAGIWVCASPPAAAAHPTALHGYHMR